MVDVEATIFCERESHKGIIIGKQGSMLKKIDYSGMTAMIFGEIYRHNGEWKFNAIGQGTKDTSISELCRHYK